MFDGPPRGFVVSTDSAIWLYTTTFEKQVGSSHAQTSQFNSDSQTLMELQDASPTTRMILFGTPKTILRKLMESVDMLKQHTEELSGG